MFINRGLRQGIVNETAVLFDDDARGGGCPRLMVIENLPKWKIPARREPAIL
jgi:hypothetical protein